MSTQIEYYSFNDSATIAPAVYILSQYTSNGSESNVYINNSVKIPFTHQSNGMANINHSNASIWLKDSVLSGGEAGNIISWQKIQSRDGDLTYNDSIILTEYNAGDILSNVFLYEASNVSNITINGNYTEAAYVNFINGTNRNQGPSGVGFRFSNSAGRLQFSNNGSAWYDITSANTTRLDDLEDVAISNIAINQYLKWDQSSNLWINSNLAISNDPHPTLSSNLTMNGYGLISNGLGVYNTSGNLVVNFGNVGPSAVNYLTINNSNLGSDPSITTAGSDTDIGITLNTKGDADIILNAGANLYINSDNLDISGYIKNSIYRTSSNTSYYPSNTWTIPISSDTVLFDFYDTVSPHGSYWANVSAGVEGQKLNLIMNSNVASGYTIWVDFGTDKLGTGNGLATKMKMNKSGQSASLIYLGYPQDIWQILNTGSQTY